MLIFLQLFSHFAFREPIFICFFMKFPRKFTSRVNFFFFIIFCIKVSVKHIADWTKSIIETFTEFCSCFDGWLDNILNFQFVKICQLNIQLVTFLSECHQLLINKKSFFIFFCLVQKFAIYSHFRVYFSIKINISLLKISIFHGFFILWD
jgi:hypothetical protein